MPHSGPNVGIVAPLSRAIELTRRILFRPFEFEKWLVLGFAAFISGWFNSLGGGFNYRYSNGRTFSFHGDYVTPLFITIIVAVSVLVLAFVIVWLWVTCRGRFVFIDCIVRERALIREPWREFRAEGDSLFRFLLLIMLAVFAVVVLFAGLIVLGFLLRTGRPSFHDVGLWIAIGVLFILWITAAVILNVITYFMPLVMYARRCSAIEAARSVVRLILADPVPFILFVLLMIALWIGWFVLGLIVTCATCCIAALPYLGTVIVLPVPVFFRVYGLLFLRQFGPEWDAWSRSSPPRPLIPPPAQPIT